jgi:hypothetical protein
MTDSPETEKKAPDVDSAALKPDKHCPLVVYM